MKHNTDANKVNKQQRRRAILGVGAISGASALSAWHKPVIKSMVLPVHAQMSEEEEEPTVIVDQFINNNINVSLAATPDSDSIIDRVAGIVVSPAHAGHTTPDGGAVIVDVNDTSFDAMLITDENMVANGGGRQQFSGSGGTVDGDPLRLDLVRGGDCDDFDGLFIEISVSNVTETVADYDFTAFNNGTTVVYSSAGTVQTGLTPAADLPTDCGLMGASDIRLKTAIEPLTRTDTGFQLYRFQYLNDAAKTDYVGVMAQDLEQTHSEALIVGKDGYYKVRYDLLGLQMTTLEEWNRVGLASVTKH